MKKQRFRSQIYYAEAIERVWRALTDPSELSKWLTKGNFKAQRGYRFKWKEVTSSESEPAPLENAICEIQEVQAPRRLVYRLEHDSGSSSIVTWSLDPVGDGTQLIVEQELVLDSSASPQMRLHPNVVSVATYLRQRNLLKLKAEIEVSLERLGVLICMEAA